ncbi:hypothetical protein [Caulobacter sp. NIBR2454]|uniref:hypothetical protein n=1 Tax=Caulobacter sp. NIBR2454 TaxID=3015996 RepID=UPI0022B629C2|nr:hypothetical protein [Caulobacter sp. NIBR2454]
MGVNVRNAVVQNDGRTVASAHFVAAQGLSQTDKVAALSALVNDAAATLGLPFQGPEAAEVLYQIADERAGATSIAFETNASTTGVSEPEQEASWRQRLWRTVHARTVIVAASALVLGALVGAVLRGA